MRTSLAILATILFILPQVMFAKDHQPPLNKITMQLTTQQWVETTSAKVTVRVNASLDESGLASAHSNIQNKLQKIADKVTWHITQFDRNKDQSGLESLIVAAEARVPQQALAPLRENAKSISKPGETYTIQNIDFSPSEQEIEQTRSQLRSKLYEMSKQELGNVNKIYGDEVKFFVHNINFLDHQIQPAKAQMRAYATEMATVEAGGMAVSNELSMMATVIFAANLK